jgi:hypothetical protein
LLNATTIVVSLLAAVGLAVVHFLSGKLRFLEGIPRSIWLSMAGGVFVATSLSIYSPSLPRARRRSPRRWTKASPSRSATSTCWRS